jgi:hypothetical protein
MPPAFGEASKFAHSSDSPASKAVRLAAHAGDGHRRPALRFMQVHEFAKNRNLRDLSLPISSLYLLAAPHSPANLPLGNNMQICIFPGRRYGAVHVRNVLSF